MLAPSIAPGRAIHQRPGARGIDLELHFLLEQMALPRVWRRVSSRAPAQPGADAPEVALVPFEPGDPLGVMGAASSRGHAGFGRGAEFRGE